MPHSFKRLSFVFCPFHDFEYFKKQLTELQMELISNRIFQIIIRGEFILNN